ncbi:DUF6326 family protein [Fusibacter bizertensis]|uniref:DUF6326 family protein n=1 Tax=Fusibacter bizertensis TaxID=1488331 RepID=A0ABT6NCG7_9FIRM|nr:DUF6326 family protein [Fusibacter bizertensis]MDH8678110.1 DUF6326 family protein [Fusibacter bizertensis]
MKENIMKENEIISRGTLNFRTKITLASIWTSFMIFYLYADVLSFYRPGVLNHIIEGFMGPLQANQSNLLMASMLMAIPALMIPLSIVLKDRVSRVANIVISTLYIFVNIGNLVGETWIYYIAYGVIEIILNITMIFIAIRWKTK